MLPEHGFEPVTLRIDIFWWKPSYDFFTSLWYCPKMVATYLSGDPGLQQLMSTASPKSCSWPRVCTLSMSIRPLFGYQAPAGEPDKEVKASWLEAWYTSDFCYPSTALVIKNWFAGLLLVAIQFIHFFVCTRKDFVLVLEMLNQAQVIQSLIKRVFWLNLMISSFLP